MPQHGPPGDPHGKRKFRREPVSEQEKSPGYRVRERELDELEEAAEAGSTQAKVRLPQARGALQRQEHVIRLKRKRRPTP